ncbi:MAG TPA: hypothetical protein PKM21_11490 [Anaerolineales bacterium]|nr:hypothetical protein [Anaerolineales bacterium]
MKRKPDKDQAQAQAKGKVTSIQDEQAHCADPTPTDLKIAQTTLPVGVNGMSQAKRNDSRACADEIECGCRQDQTQALKRISVPDFVQLQLKTSRFVVQEVLFKMV